MIRKSTLKKSSYVPPETILEIKCADSKIDSQRLGIYKGTSLCEVYDSIKAVFDIPSEYRINLQLGDGTDFALTEELPPTLECNLIKKPKKRTMWFRDITEEWVEYIPKRKRRKMEAKKTQSADENSEEKKDEELTPVKKTEQGQPTSPESPESPLKMMKIPKNISVPIKIVCTQDDAPDGYIGAAAAMGREEEGVIVCGGITEDGEVTEETYKYDFDMNEWEMGTDGEARCFHSLTWIPGRKQLLAFGGYKLEDDEKVPLQEPKGYSEETWFPSTLHGERPEARYGHTVTALDDYRLFLWGGFDEKEARGDSRILDAETWSWKRACTSGNAPTARGFHTATLVGGKLVLIGGYDLTTTFGTIHSLDLKTMVWSQPELKGKKLTPRCKHKTILLDEKRIAIIGGQIESGEGVDAEKVKDTLVLDTETWELKSLDLLYGLSALETGGHIACKVNHEDGDIFLFGGDDRNARILKIE